jgi:hypothetical protein
MRSFLRSIGKGSVSGWIVSKTVTLTRGLSPVGFRPALRKPTLNAGRRPSATPSSLEGSSTFLRRWLTGSAIVVRSDDLSRVTHQAFEQRELLLRQLQPPVALFHDARNGIQAERGDGQAGARSKALHAVLNDAAQTALRL